MSIGLILSSCDCYIWRTGILSQSRI